MKILIYMMCLVLMANKSSCDLYGEYSDRLDTFISSMIYEDKCDIYNELLRLHFNKSDEFCEEGILKEVDRINSHTDGVDFNLATLGWLLNKYWDSPLLSNNAKEAVIGAVTNVTLFYSDPGYLGGMQYWSENHQIGWNAAEYLIGSAFATRPELSNILFLPTGQLGAYHQARGAEKLKRWLEYRIKYGFSEFNSDTYGPIAYKALASVAGCAPDPEIKLLAQIVLNMQLLDHILGSHSVRLATPRGRAYSEGKLLKGEGYFHMYVIKGEGKNDVGSSDSETFQHTLAVLHGYELPPVLLEVAEELRNNKMGQVLEQRFGLDDYAENGVGGSNAEECTFWTGNGGYFSPRHPRCIFIIGDEYQLWNRSNTWMGELLLAKVIWDLDPNVVDLVGEIAAPFGHGVVLGPANMRTFRTPEVMLSSVQDYKGGYMAGQQHVWQATLDISRHGSVFTVQPTSADSDSSHSSSYWVGGIMPKVGQVDSTLLAIYSPEVLPTVAFGLEMTHAHFSLHEYDEWIYLDNIGGGGWHVGRQGDAYVALFSWQPIKYVDDDGNIQNEDLSKVRDLVANGVQNVWICEVGTANIDSSFESFTNKIASSQVSVEVIWDNSPIECLVDNHCLDSGLEHFIDCLLNICVTKVDQDVENCLQTMESNIDLLDIPTLKYLNFDIKHFLLAGCLSKQIKRSEVTVTYARGDGHVINFSWDGPLVVDGAKIKMDDFHRHNHQFSEMEWGARNISVEAGGRSLFMDFDNLSIVET